MSDDDRLADYLARLEDPDYRRVLADGCVACNRSVVSCNSSQYLDKGRCCAICSHPTP